MRLPEPDLRVYSVGPHVLVVVFREVTPPEGRHTSLCRPSATGTALTKRSPSDLLRPQRCADDCRSSPAGLPPIRTGRRRSGGQAAAQSSKSSRCHGSWRGNEGNLEAHPEPSGRAARRARHTSGSVPVTGAIRRTPPQARELCGVIDAFTPESCAPAVSLAAPRMTTRGPCPPAPELAPGGPQEDTSGGFTPGRLELSVRYVRRPSRKAPARSKTSVMNRQKPSSPHESQEGTSLPPRLPQVRAIDQKDVHTLERCWAGNSRLASVCLRMASGRSGMARSRSHAW